MKQELGAFPYHIFRKYDIRGVYGAELTLETAYRTGSAFGGLCLERTGADKPLVAIGMDARVHSPEIRDAFAAGLSASGCSWMDIGLCPTPLVYFCSHELGTDAFVMVTASHNPPGDNGFKLGIGQETIHSADIEQLGIKAASEDTPARWEKPDPVRTVDILAIYEEFMVKAFYALGEKIHSLAGGLEIVVDSGNGTAGVVFPGILKKLGVTVHELYSEPDGTFPNHHPDPTLPEALESLRAEILRTRSGFGVSFDGDADRIGIMDEKGDIIWGDMLLLILGRDIVNRWSSEGKKGDPPLVISEVKASQVLYDGIREAGGRALMWKTGHSLIKAKMKETGAAAAGEMSGHLFFADRYFGFDDGLYGAMRILEVYVNALMDGSVSLFSDLLGGIPDTVTTPEIRFPCSEESKFRLVDSFAAALADHMKEGREPVIRETIDIDGIRALFDDGWGLLRASNTQPVLVMRFEGPDETHVERYQAFFTGLLEETQAALEKDA